MIPKLRFGRTGHMSTRALFGAVALAFTDDEQTEQTLEWLLHYGINHIDTAASYGNSEDRIGAWMPEHRDRFFLATKTAHRDYQTAREEIHRSLERLRVSHLDLIQLHNVVEESDWQKTFSPDGALRAAIEAREDGIVRFIGITGHGLEVPRVQLRSLGEFDFDSVLLPLNYSLMQNTQYAAEFEELRAVCRERDVAMQTIKSICRRPKNKHSLPRATWYEPLEDEESIALATHWTLGQDDVFLNTVGDFHVLPHVLKAAANYSAPPSDEEMKTLCRAQEIAPLFV